jgi:hypothetical protein
LSTRDYVAAVDDADYARVRSYRWSARVAKRTVYAQRQMKRDDGSWTVQAMHTFLTGWPQVDHRDGDGLNNQRANLRPASALQNMWNRRKLAAASSRFKGVCWKKDMSCWVARITVDGVRRHLGYFGSEDAAARAYDNAAAEEFGEFAKLNFPQSLI